MTLSRCCCALSAACTGVLKRAAARQGGWYEGSWRRGERDGDGVRLSRAGAVSAGHWRAGALNEPGDLAAVAPAVAAAQQAARAARRCGSMMPLLIRSVKSLRILSLPIGLVWSSVSLQVAHSS